ncbi:MAG: MMPL family transporter, partial [Tepidisphaeraceae bacterium]
ELNAPGHEPKWTVRSHLTHRLLTTRLLARTRDGLAPAVALVTIGYHLPYDSDASQKVVERVESITSRHVPGSSGLNVEVTGTAGMGRDQHLAADVAHRRITVAAVIAVVTVLLAVYRAPLAAGIPLACVAVSAYVATQILQLARSWGVPISSQELTYLVVIVFGAGTDYSLFWLSRFDEELAARRWLRIDAAERAYVATMPGIIASAATTILGLCALLVSQYLPNHVLGLSMAMSLAIALLAAMTLMPALAVLMGARLFWPRRKPLSASGNSSRWKLAALWVTRRPVALLAVLAALLAVPLWESFRAQYRIDTDAGMLPDSSFARGRAAAEGHFGASILFPWTCLVQLDADQDTMHNQLSSLPAQIDQALLREGAHDVWSVVNPLGRRVPLGATLAGLFPGEVSKAYWNVSHRCMRFEVMASDAPFSPQAISDFRRAMTAVRRALADAHVRAEVLAAGPTPFMANALDLSSSDEIRIRAAVIAVVAAIVLLLVRDAILTFVLMLVTLVAFQATMGLSSL